MSDVEQIGRRTPDGVTIGGDTTDKISVYGVTPVDQAAAITWAASTSTGATADIAGIEVAMTEIVAALQAFGITA